MFQSVGTAITNYCSLGGLNSKHLFLMVLEAGKSKVEVLADSGLGKGTSSWLVDGHLLLIPLPGREQKEKQAFLCLFF